MLRLESVTKVYKKGERPALGNVSLSVERGEIVALIGPSGAGKSTLLRTINGLVRPDSGRVMVEGQDVARLTGGALQSVRRRSAMIFQEFHLIDRLPVLINVLSGGFGRYSFWRAALRLWPAQEVRLARQLLERVGLQGFERNLARELSGGQRQRVAIARAMMQRPAILMGDEPVSSLDPVTARSVLTLLTELAREEGLTLILSLHDLALAREFCPRAVGVSGGRIVYDGPMSALTDEQVARVYGGEVRRPAEGEASGDRDSLTVALEKGCGRQL